MDKKSPWKFLILYGIPSIVNQSLPNALTPNNIKSGFVATGVRLFNTDTCTDGDLPPSAVAD
jgi:hypothetical protein